MIGSEEYNILLQVSQKSKNGYGAVKNNHMDNNSRSIAQSGTETTDLFTACANNNLKLVEELINNGADVNHISFIIGHTPLHIAARIGSVELVELLIQKKANINCTNLSGNTPLHLAAEKGHFKCIDFIMAECLRSFLEIPDLNYKNKDGNTPLHLAAQNGHVECIKSLLYGFNYQNTNRDYNIVVSLRIKSICDQIKLGSTNDNKKTALDLAIENLHHECVLLLIEKTKEINGIKAKQKSKLCRAIETQYYYYIGNSIKEWKLNNKVKKERKKETKHKKWVKTLSLAIEHKPGSWIKKRETILGVLKVADESAINTAYDYAKNYALRKDDGKYVLKTFQNHFLVHDNRAKKNSYKLEKQNLFIKNCILYTSNLSIAAYSIMVLIKQIPWFPKTSNAFINIEFVSIIVFRVIAISMIPLVFYSYRINKKLDELKDYKNKIEEVAKLTSEVRDDNLVMEEPSCSSVTSARKISTHLGVCFNEITIEDKTEEQKSSLGAELNVSNNLRRANSVGYPLTAIDKLEPPFSSQTIISRSQPSMQEEIKCKKSSDEQLIKNSYFIQPCIVIQEPSAELGK